MRRRETAALNNAVTSFAELALAYFNDGDASKAAESFRRAAAYCDNLAQAAPPAEPRKGEEAS